jgi:hypothetical protein
MDHAMVSLRSRDVTDEGGSPVKISAHDQVGYEACDGNKGRRRNGALCRGKIHVNHDAFISSNVTPNWQRFIVLLDAQDAAHDSQYG